MSENPEHDAISSVIRSPRSVDLELTSRCNLRCKYCYFFDNEAVSYTDLPTDTWLTFIKELGSCAVMRVTLQGGEPFCRADLPELIQGVVENHMRFSILTNGTLITDELASMIAATGRCDMVQVSIDGATAGTHEASRGAGSFAPAQRGLAALQRNGVNVAVRVTINKGNLHHLDAIAQLLLEDLHLPSFSTNSAGYVGSCRQRAETVMLTVEDRMQAMSTLTALARKYPGRITANAGPLADARYWGRMEAARRDGSPAFSNGGHLTGCGCVNESMAVRADGTYIPCVMLAHMELGQILKSSLLDVWQNSPILHAMRNRCTVPLSEFPYCAECAHEPYCTGNCPGLSYTLTGEVNHPSPDACLRKFLEDGGTLDESMVPSEQS